MDIAGYDELGLVYGILEFSKRFLGIEPFWFWAEGWSLAWKINLWARFRNGNRALELIRNVYHLVRDDIGGMTGGGVYPNLFGAHPPFQIDGNFGFTAGIAEMLLQSHADFIHFFQPYRMHGKRVP